MRTIVLLTLSALWSMVPASRADEHEGIAFPRIGKLTPRHAREITGSNWSVGAETMDRDFTVYRHWRDYLGPLGIKKARLQAGWARTEQKKGVYDFAWLDEAVFDMPKPAYYAVQNLAAVFDDRLARIRDYPVDIPEGLPLTVHGYEHRGLGWQVVAAWFHDKIPADENAKTPVDFEFAGGWFTEPVYVDLRTGIVYEIPRTHWQQIEGIHRFKAIPCYDSPILIADKQALFVTPAP